MAAGKRLIDKTKKIENKAYRKVAFTKRRNGLFKKCEELCVNHGVQIGVITFSESGKLFTFGNPNLDDLLHRNRNRNGNCNDNSVVNRVINGDNDVNGGENSNGYWWDEVEVEKLGLAELEEFKMKLEGLRDEVVSRVDKISKNCSNSNVGSEEVAGSMTVEDFDFAVEDIDFGDDFDGFFEAIFDGQESMSLIPALKI